MSQSTESDLEAETQKTSKEVACEKSLKGNDDDTARYIKRAQDYFTLSLDYISQFLPPTAMILLQVTLSSLSSRLTFHHPRLVNPVFRHSSQKLFCNFIESWERTGSVFKRTQPWAHLWRMCRQKQPHAVYRTCPATHQSKSNFIRA